MCDIENWRIYSFIVLCCFNEMLFSSSFSFFSQTGSQRKQALLVDRLEGVDLHLHQGMFDQVTWGHFRGPTVGFKHDSVGLTIPLLGASSSGSSRVPSC